MPGSETRSRCRCATFALVIPVARSLESLRCGFSPNSGHSLSAVVAACAVGPVGLGIEPAPAVGVEPSAALPALEPQAVIRTQAQATAARRVRWRTGIPLF